MNSLNPVLKVDYQVAEPLFVHRQVRRKRQAYEKVRHVFNLLGLPQDFLNRYAFALNRPLKRSRALLALSSTPKSPNLNLSGARRTLAYHWYQRSSQM